MKKKRECLKCKREFLSSGVGNRVCYKCNRENQLKGKLEGSTVIKGIRVDIIN